MVNFKVLNIRNVSKVGIIPLGNNLRLDTLLGNFLQITYKRCNKTRNITNTDHPSSIQLNKCSHEH